MSSVFLERFMAALEPFFKGNPGVRPCSKCMELIKRDPEGNIHDLNAVVVLPDNVAHVFNGLFDITIEEGQWKPSVYVGSSICGEKISTWEAESSGGGQLYLLFASSEFRDITLRSLLKQLKEVLYWSHPVGEISIASSWGFFSPVWKVE